MFGEIAGAVIGPLTEAGSAAAQYQASKHERNVAWRRMQAWELMAPSLRVEGLRKAGINPLLAAMSGFGGSGTNVPTADPGSGGVNMPENPVGGVISNIRQQRLMDEEIEIRRQQKLQEQERTKQAVVDTDVKQRFGVGMARAEYQAQIESILNLVAERDLAGARRGEAEQMKLRTATDRLLMQMGIPGARAMEELYDKYPWLRQVKEFGGGGLFGTAVGAGTAGAVGGIEYMKRKRGEIADPFQSRPAKRGEPARRKR